VEMFLTFVRRWIFRFECFPRNLDVLWENKVKELEDAAVAVESLL
jgi:hypothetical protein